MCQKFWIFSIVFFKNFEIFWLFWISAPSRGHRTTIWPLQKIVASFGFKGRALEKQSKSESIFSQKNKVIFKILKKWFFLWFLSKKYHPVVILAREARFWHQKSLFRKFDFFSDLSVFWSIFREIRSKSQKFIFKFFKNFYFFRVFYNARAFLTTWMIECTLQNINRSIRLAAITFRKGPLCPPTVTKNSSETTFGVLLRHNYTSVTPNNFRRQTTFIMKVTSQKSTISEKKSKITKKRQNHDFSKNFDFCDFWLLCIFARAQQSTTNDPICIKEK